MPRFRVPRSTRTMYGTVSPASVVVIRRSAGGAAAGLYAFQQLLAGGAVGGFGSGSTFKQPAVDVRYQSLNSVAMLHCTSNASVDRPLALLAGVLPLAARGSGVAHTNGMTCGPDSSGPPIEWLVTTRVEAPTPPSLAVITLSPSASPVTRPMIR